MGAKRPMNGVADDDDGDDDGDEDDVNNDDDDEPLSTRRPIGRLTGWLKRAAEAASAATRRQGPNAET